MNHSQPHEQAPVPSPDPQITAQIAGLRYCMDTIPGIRRQRVGRRFRYRSPEGVILRDKNELHRIKTLAIPPAWTDVWICPTPYGHLQATGRDTKGRKQYRYHPRWREVRDETKYGRLLAFGEVLPRLRQRIDQDLARPGLPREKVLATVVGLLETTFMRIGNDEYARANGSFGLTTLRNRHVAVAGGTVTFEFRGKWGKTHTISLHDRRLAAIVKRCRELPGYELFQYFNETGERQAVDSGQVNAYLREITGQDFTAKDFRTWAGTVFAFRALLQYGPCSSEAQAKQQIGHAITVVAQQLGNTPKICRACYIHPAIIDTYLDGSLFQANGQHRRSRLRAEEANILALLAQRQTSELDQSLKAA